MAVLQALQRLSTSRFASAEALVSPAAVARVFAALSCGDDFVATEAARFLTRLWAPAVSASCAFATADASGACPFDKLAASLWAPAASASASDAADSHFASGACHFARTAASLWGPAASASCIYYCRCLLCRRSLSF